MFRTARYMVEPTRSFLLKASDRHTGDAFLVLDTDDNGRRVAMVDRQDDAECIASLLNSHGGPA